MKVIHSWLKEYVGDALPEAAEVERLLTFHAFEVEQTEQIEGEDVIEVKVLPDRASDSLSHRGVARELGSILGVTLQYDPLRNNKELPTTTEASILVADQTACLRFTATIITGVEIKESPAWLQKRLRALGQRPINNIVDATNYIMFALGQPMHAYDADTLSKSGGAYQLGVRFARAGETVQLLPESGKTEERVVELIESDVVIVDGVTDVPVGLAGIKGGRYAELRPQTKTILIEAAHFNPTLIRKTARRLGVITDAAKRFENNPTPYLPQYAQAEIVDLITEIAGGTCVGMVDVSTSLPEPRPIKISVARVNALLGVHLTQNKIKEIIERIGAAVNVDAEENLLVVPPFERTDLVLEENFIEEVGRIYGLHNIISIPPTPVPLQAVNSKQYYSDAVRRILVEIGFSEVITSSFQKKGELQLLQALASDKSYVRSSLQKNITTVLDANFTHGDLLGMRDIRVFEIGTVFTKADEGIEEHLALALGVRSKGNGYHGKDDELLNAAIAVLEEVIGIGVVWQREKGVAELNLSAVCEGLPVPTAYEAYTKSSDTYYKSISPYPAIARDIAIWTDGTQSDVTIAACLTTAAGPLLVRHTLFDTFMKDGRTSYAFRLVFQATNRTLTDVEINTIMERVYQVALQQGWEVR